MLYVMVIAIIFGMLLEFYLQVTVDTYKNLKAERQYLLAQTMERLAKERLGSKAGSVKFDQGTCVISKDKKTTIVLSDGTKYSF